MILFWRDGYLQLVGDIDHEMSEDPRGIGSIKFVLGDVLMWAQLVKEHELEWLEDMAKRRVKK